MYCIVCKKDKVFPSETSDHLEEDLLWKKDKRKDGSIFNINNEMVTDGIIHIIDAGYGSTHDGDQFIIAICDDCIKENLQDATILYYDNYMYSNHYPPHVGFIEEEREKSKKAYRRRKNLDNLT